MKNHTQYHLKKFHSVHFFKKSFNTLSQQKYTSSSYYTKLCYFYGFLLRKILEILQFFQHAKIYEAMENVGIALFCRICVLAAIITMTFLILDIFCGDESLISIFHFLCKTIVPVYCSAYVPFLLSKKILSCSLRFIKFLILCTLRMIISFLRFLSYLIVLYLLSVFLTSNRSCIGSVFDVNVSCIVNDNFTTLGHF